MCSPHYALISTNSYLHMNVESVIKGQDFGIGGILVSIPVPAISTGTCFGCMQVNSPCGERNRWNTLVEMSSGPTKSIDVCLVLNC